MKIDHFETGLYRIPLPTPIQAASTPVITEFDLVTVRLRDSDGGSGCGYTVLSSGQGGALIAIIENVFAGIVLGEDPRCIEWLWERM
jgi:L-alanine-DL-glutamate epimerase-like enolase superfamily enzyme